MTTNLFLRHLVIALAIVSGPFATVNESTAAESTPIPAVHSDVWLIETRGLPAPCSQHGVSAQMEFQRFDGGCFVRASRQDFLQTLNPAQTTCFFVHGNRVTADDARTIGLSVLRRLDCGSVPFRYVIWSWPSERIAGMIRDARAKASRADSESYYLGSMLASIQADADVSLIGYSFGARAITGSMHLLGGGMLCGNTLATADEPTVRPRAILMAAALPRSWLLPGGANGLAPLQVERMLLFYNPRDPALRHFPTVFRPGRPQALGLEGIAAYQLGPNGSLLQQFNVGNNIGRSHSFSRYTDSASIMATVRNAALEAPKLNMDAMTSQHPTLAVPRR